MNKIALGSAQFGINYGINNKNGEISENEVIEICDYAFKNNIDLIDTARVYGNSERKIGKYLEKRNNINFKIVTKIPKCEFEDAEMHLKESLSALKQNKIYGCLMHSYDEYKSDKRLWEFLNIKKNENIIQKIGFSLYFIDDLIELQKEKIKFDLLQIPFNLLDRRFEKHLKSLYDEGVEIHSRSVFLQGLFFKNLNSIKGKLLELKPKLELIKKIALENDITELELSLNFVLNNKYISKIIVGVDGIEHLKQIITASEKNIDFENINSKLTVLIENNEKLILPFNWN